MRKTRYTDRHGFSLVEVIVVTGMVGILLAIAVPGFGMLERFRVKDCAKRLATDVKHARASASSEGRRGQLVLTSDGVHRDYNGDGNNELWLTFLDSYPGPNTKYDAGETVLASSSCSGGITIEAGTNPLGVCADIADARCMWFSSIGTLKSGATNQNIVVTSISDNSYKARVQVVSITGYLAVQLCEVTGVVDCSNSDDWHDI